MFVTKTDFIPNYLYRQTIQIGCIMKSFKGDCIPLQKWKNLMSADTGDLLVKMYVNQKERSSRFILGRSFFSFNLHIVSRRRNLLCLSPLAKFSRVINESWAFTILSCLRPLHRNEFDDCYAMLNVLETNGQLVNGYQTVEAVLEVTKLDEGKYVVTVAAGEIS